MVQPDSTAHREKQERFANRRHSASVNVGVKPIEAMGGRSSLAVPLYQAATEDDRFRSKFGS